MLWNQWQTDKREESRLDFLVEEENEEEENKTLHSTYITRVEPRRTGGLWAEKKGDRWIDIEINGKGFNVRKIFGLGST